MTQFKRPTIPDGTRLFVNHLCGARIVIPDDRNFETEGEAIESDLRRTVEGVTSFSFSLCFDEIRI
jgi:hypothetical protein